MKLRRKDYARLNRELRSLPEAERRAHMRNLARTDLWYLLRYILNRRDLETTPKKADFLFKKCREVQASPNNHLDLWSREHYKSTIITFGRNIQDILASHGDDPLPHWDGVEVTIGIFSHTRPIAKSFLRQIKEELEKNTLLQELFPDILYADPKNEAQKWSEDAGLIVRRRSNPKEATVEAWGLVDGQPTGMHYVILCYDDVVTLSSVNSPEQIAKTTTALELSYNLGNTEIGVRRFIGTRYHYNDTYRTLIERGTVEPRIVPATDNGKFDGTPVMWDRSQFEAKVRDQGPYTASCQLLQNPAADESQGLKREWLRWWEPVNGWAAMNRYILVDPANEKKKESDFTAMVVLGLGPDGNLYWIDGVRDRLNVKERADMLIFFHRKYRPLGVGYEKYGKDVDIDYIERVQQEMNYRFDITPLGGQMKKTDRIKRLVPDLVNHKWYWPTNLYKTLYDGKMVDIVERTLVEEYDPFPVPVHDDMLDILSRIYDEDMQLVWPKFIEPSKGDRYTKRPGNASWTVA